MFPPPPAYYVIPYLSPRKECVLKKKQKGLFRKIFDFPSFKTRHSYVCSINGLSRQRISRRWIWFFVVFRTPSLLGNIELFSHISRTNIWIRGQLYLARPEEKGRNGGVCNEKNINFTPIRVSLKIKLEAFPRFFFIFTRKCRLFRREGGPKKIAIRTILPRSLPFPTFSSFFSGSGGGGRGGEKIVSSHLLRIFREIVKCGKTRVVRTMLRCRGREKASLQQEEKSCLGIRKKKEKSRSLHFPNFQKEKKLLFCFSVFKFAMALELFCLGLHFYFFVGKDSSPQKKYLSSFASIPSRIATRILAPFFSLRTRNSPFFLPPGSSFFISFRGECGDVQMSEYHPEGQ